MSLFSSRPPASRLLERQLSLVEQERDSLRRRLASAESRARRLEKELADSASALPHDPSAPLRPPTDEEWHEAICEAFDDGEHYQADDPPSGTAHAIHEAKDGLLYCKHFSDNLTFHAAHFGMPPLMLLPTAALFYFCGALIGRRERSSAEVERAVRGMLDDLDTGEKED